MRLPSTVSSRLLAGLITFPLLLSLMAILSPAFAQEAGPLYRNTPVQTRNLEDLISAFGGVPYAPGSGCAFWVPCIELSRVPAARTVADANSTLSDRTGVAIYAGLNIPLKNNPDGSSVNANENYGLAALARWAYPHYFNVPDGDPKQPYADHRGDTARSLLSQLPGFVGSDVDSKYAPLWWCTRPGNYDFLLPYYITLLYKYYDDLQGWYNPNTRETVADHIVNTLLNVSGPLNAHELEVQLCPSPRPPETENHLILIEAERYLTNQILYQRTHDCKYDNRRNGSGSQTCHDPSIVGDSVKASAVWLLEEFQQVLKTEFTEYNARPYQDEIMKALLMLSSYAYDDDVRLSARMVLDYISAKVAVSSNDLRRAPPFRRRNEDEFWGPVVGPGTGFLASPLLVPDPAQTYEPDPQGTWFALLAGNTQLLGGQAPSEGRGSFAAAMIFAGLQDYRIPDMILDLFVNRPHRRYYQVLRHNKEIYAGSPSYLISAGGVPSPYAYSVFGSGLDTDLGVGMPTTIIPTGEGLKLSDMIQFGTRVLNPTITHLCVAPDFACGAGLFLPDSLRNNISVNQLCPDLLTLQSVPDLAGCSTGFWGDSWHTTWRFLNNASSNSGQPGYYLAVYDGSAYGDSVGLLEAYDTWLNPGLRFNQFVSHVLTQYGATRFGIGTNSYVTAAGQVLRFVVGQAAADLGGSNIPEAVNRIVESSWIPSAPVTSFASGDIIRSPEPGLITISNPSLPGQQITLDLRDASRPVRTTTSEAGEVRVEKSGIDVHAEVWVDFNLPVTVPDLTGDSTHPFRRLADAQKTVANGGVIKIVPGSTGETITLGGKNMTLVSFREGAAIGKQ